MCMHTLHTELYRMWMCATRMYEVTCPNDRCLYLDDQERRARDLSVMRVPGGIPNPAGMEMRMYVCTVTYLYRYGVDSLQEEG